MLWLLSHRNEFKAKRTSKHKATRKYRQKLPGKSKSKVHNSRYNLKDRIANMRKVGRNMTFADALCTLGQLS